MPRRARVPLALFASLALLAVACDGEKPSIDFPPVQAVVPPPDPAPPPVDRSPGSAAAVMDALCEEPAFQSPSQVPTRSDVETEIARIQRQVEAVRGLEYLTPVSTEAISQSEMARRVGVQFRIQYPEAPFARRSRAWATIGVVPSGTDLREALISFGESGVIGFYDPATGQLVYSASGDLGFIETLTLAHELTHAIDDQHFDLARLDRFVNGCRDEEFMAGLGAVEGSAQFFATEVLRRFPVSIGLDDATTGLGGLGDVPPFLLDLQLWPYNYGHGFMIALDRRGGLDAVNRALRRLPESTEQVLHPERYPNDKSQPVDIPALGPAVGLGWDDLDVMQVGEEWLRAMLKLRLEQQTANGAAAGWDGGLYRAWTDGDRVGVVLRTVWDSPNEAEQFVRAMDLWIGDSDGSADVRQVTETDVLAFFATDQGTLQLFSSAF